MLKQFEVETSSESGGERTDISQIVMDKIIHNPELQNVIFGETLSQEEIRERLHDGELGLEDYKEITRALIKNRYPQS